MKIIITKLDPTDPLVQAFAEPPSVEGEAEYRKLMIVEELLQLMKEQGITRSELAKRMGVQPSRITSMMSGSNNFTIETLVRAGRAVGAEIEMHFVPMKKSTGKSAKKTARSPAKLSRVAEKGAEYGSPQETEAPLSPTP